MQDTQTIAVLAEDDYHERYERYMDPPSRCTTCGTESVEGVFPASPRCPQGHLTLVVGR